MPLRVLDTAPDHVTVHATAVAFRGQGALLTGPAGSGKSGLALELMALGSQLVSDDVVRVARTPGRLALKPPPSAPSAIEVRGWGVVPATTMEAAPLRVVLDLSETASERLPPPRHIEVLGQAVPLLHKPLIPQVAAALLQYLSFPPHPVSLNTPYD